MPDRAICHKCIQDKRLQATVESEGEPQLCEVCGEDSNDAFTYEQLGKELEPVMREHFELGPTVRKFYDDDREGWDQLGDPLSDLIQEVIGQDVDDPDELVAAMMEAEDYYPGDGGDAFFDTTSNYIHRRATAHAWMAEWSYLREELAHRRRFFSDGARGLFDRLFEGIVDLKSFNERRRSWSRVVYQLPVGRAIHRARSVRSDGDLKTFLEAPAKELGAPPPRAAPAGRMNPNGIPVFYGALDAKTCLAEMRPAIGSQALVGTFRTTQRVRVLDFRRLEAARLGALSYFDPQYGEQRERAVFLRHLHSLISRPVVPGKEDEYLITQTMAEYLAHVHRPAFDGVIFGSVQRKGGANIVLFGRDGLSEIDTIDPDFDPLPLFRPPVQGDEHKVQLAFPVEYIDKSAKLHQTRAIQYSHDELSFSLDDGRVTVYDHDYDEIDEEGW
jgi:RES domain